MAFVIDAFARRIVGWNVSSSPTAGFVLQVPSVGNVGDSYYNALAETINGLFKAEVIWRQRSWPSLAPVEMAMLQWFNNQRLFGPIGYVTPVEAEASYYAHSRKPLWQHNPNQTAAEDSGTL